MEDCSPGAWRILEELSGVEQKNVLAVVEMVTRRISDEVEQERRGGVTWSRQGVLKEALCSSPSS